MSEANRELANEMAAPVFTDYDPSRPWIIVLKDHEEGSRAMWRECERFYLQDEARAALRQIRENQFAYEDRTGEECMRSFKIVEDTRG